MLTQRIYDDRPSSGKNRQTWVLPDGTTLGQYTIISMLREDNFSITYLARNIFLNYEVELCEHLPKMFAQRSNLTFEVIPSAGNELNYQTSLASFNNTINALIQEQHSNVAEVLAFFSALGTTYCVTPHYTDPPLTQAAPPPSAISENWLHPVLSSLLKAIQYLNKIGIGHSDINIKRILITETSAPLLTNFAFLQTANKEENALPTLGELCYRLIRGESSGVTGGLYSYKPLSSDSTLTGRFSPTFLKGIDKALAPHSESRWKSAMEWLESLENADSTSNAGSAKRSSVTVEEGVIPIITVTLKDNVSEPLTIVDFEEIEPDDNIIDIPISREPAPPFCNETTNLALGMCNADLPETSISEQQPEAAEDKDSADLPETSISEQQPEAAEDKDSADLPETIISEQQPETAEDKNSADLPETSTSDQLPDIPEAKDNADLPETIISEQQPEAAEDKNSADLPETSISDQLPDIPEAKDNADLPETIISDQLPDIPESKDNADLPETIISDQLPDIPEAKDNADLPETIISDQLPDIPEDKDNEDLPETIISDQLPDIPEDKDNEDLPETIISDQLPDIPEDKDNEDLPETIISDKIIEIPVERDFSDLPEISISDELPDVPVEKDNADMTEASISQENQPPLSGPPQDQHVDVRELTFTRMPINEGMPPIPMPPPVDADENDITLTPPPGQACPPMPQPQKQKQGYPNIQVEEFGISPTIPAQRPAPEQQGITPKAGAKVQIEDIGMSSPSGPADFNPRQAGLSSDSSIKVDDLPIGNSTPVQNQPVIPVDSPTPKKKKGCLNLFLLLVLLLLIALGVVYFVKGSEFIIEQINNLRSELETWLNSL